MGKVCGSIVLLQDPTNLPWSAVCGNRSMAVVARAVVRVGAPIPVIPFLRSKRGGRRGRRGGRRRGAARLSSVVSVSVVVAVLGKEAVTLRTSGTFATDTGAAAAACATVTYYTVPTTLQVLLSA